MEYSIKQLAQIAGTTSRTLRHYGECGLLQPSRIGANGYRFYDDQSVLVLQRILLMRRLGMPLEDIKHALTNGEEHGQALRTLAAALRKERDAIDRRLVIIDQTITALENGTTMNAHEALENINEQYKEEVTDRCGADAYKQGDNWWKSLSEGERQEFHNRVRSLNSDWIAAWEAGVSPESDNAQALAQRHIEWLCGIPGTPAYSASAVRGEFTEQVAQYVEGLANMYPADPRFAANYGGEAGAQFVRDALLHRIRN
jgi:DNA-binding transcriptional MerR regulator